MAEAGGKRLEKTLGEWFRSHLVRDSIASIALKVFYTGATLVTTIILARILGPEGYGIYAYAFALITLLSIPAQFGLPTLLVRNVAAYRVREQWGLMRGLLLRANQAVLLLSLVLVLTAGLVAYTLAGCFGVSQLTTFAWALVLLPLIALGNLRGATLRGLHRVISGQLPEQFLRPGLFVVFLLAIPLSGIGATPSLAMALHALAAFMAFAVGAWLLFRALPVQAKAVPAEYETGVWWRSVLPLGFLAGMQIVNDQTDIVMLGVFASAADVGVYRVAVQGSHLVMFTLAAVNMVLGPNIARLYTQGECEQLQRIVTWSARVILFTALPVAGAFIFFGEPILALVFGDEYMRGYTSLVILCVGQLFNAGAGSVGLLLNMTGYERDTAAGVAVAAVCNVILNLTLIPAFGMEGAATATAISLAVWNVILVRRAYQRVGIVSIGFVPTGVWRSLSKKGPK